MAMLKIWDEAKQQWIIVDAPVPNGFGIVKLGDIFIDADNPNDTLQFVEGEHIKISPNADYDSVMIGVQDIGNLADLPTIDKTDLVSAIKELNNRISDHGFTYKQLVPESIWIIRHNLNRYPSVSVTDSGGSLVIGDVQYTDENTVQITFSAEFSGIAYLN